MTTKNTSRVVAIIPARLASQRLPQKPLKDIEGKTLLQRVWERGKTATTLDRLVIATDSEEIARLARTFGGEVLMTSEAITTGSQRVAVAAGMLDEEFDLVVNLQGDMPFIRPELIDGTVRFLRERIADFDMATVATPILEQSMFLSVSDVKVVVGGDARALYFSRAPVPHSRDGNLMEHDGEAVYGFKHFGLYVFRPHALAEYESERLSALEEVEKLEQLRLLERGFRIGVNVVPAALTAGSVEVDTERDLEHSRELARRADGIK